MKNLEIIPELVKIIATKKTHKITESYVATMFDKGLDKIAQKVGEEAVETVIAAKNDDDYEFVYEAADLVFHLLMLCEARGIAFDTVLDELKKRQK